MRALVLLLVLASGCSQTTVVAVSYSDGPAAVSVTHAFRR